MPKFEAGQVPVQMPSVQNVIDVTYSLDGKNYTDVVDETASMFSTRNPGALSLVTSDKDAIVRELHATLKNGENYISETEKRIAQSRDLIAQLDTEFKEKKQTEERFAKLEETQKQQGGKLDQILALLQKNSNTPT